MKHQLQAIWAEILGHSDFGSNDNFFLVGGHSLSAVRLATAVETRWGREMPVAAIFARPTIEEQAGWLNHGEAGSAGIALENLVTLQPEGDLPPLYVVHGWGGKVGQFIEIARALAPRRPVLGLQALGPDAAGDPPTVPSIAARYADQLLARHPRSTPIHLLGHSAGGWYAYAVAAALLDRGATIGAVLLLDTQPTARIDRRIGLVVMPMHLVPRLRHYLVRVIKPPEGESRRRYIVLRLRWLKTHLDHYLLRHRNVDRAPESNADHQPDLGLPDADFYVLIHRGYRPPRLPVEVDVFVRPARKNLVERLWRFYARGGARLHPMFEEHADFIRPELMPELAVEIEKVLARSEATTAALA